MPATVINITKILQECNSNTLLIIASQKHEKVSLWRRRKRDRVKKLTDSLEATEFISLSGYAPITGLLCSGVLVPCDDEEDDDGVCSWPLLFSRLFIVLLLLLLLFRDRVSNCPITNCDKHSNGNRFGLFVKGHIFSRDNIKRWWEAAWKDFFERLSQ